MSNIDNRPDWDTIEDRLGTINTALSGTLTVDGSGSTQPVSGTVAVSSVSGTVTVNGSGVTQPVSGTVIAQINGYRSSDTSYQPLRLDKATNSIQTIEYEHHEIHSSSHFFYTDKVSLNNTGAQDYLITTPDSTTYAHMTFQATGSLITQVDLYEATDKSGSSAQTTYNSNRNSLAASTVAVHKGTTGGSTDGTLIWTMKSGNATGQSRTGMTANRSNEIILKRNTKYILRITSGTDANLTNTQLSWYEHADIA